MGCQARTKWAGQSRLDLSSPAGWVGGADIAGLYQDVRFSRFPAHFRSFLPLSTGGDWPGLRSVVKVVGRRDTDSPPRFGGADIVGLQGKIFRFGHPVISGHFPPFGGADIAGLEGLIFVFPVISGHFPPFGGADIAGLEGLISSFPLISAHSRHTGHSGLAAGSRQTHREVMRVVFAIRY